MRPTAHETRFVTIVANPIAGGFRYRRLDRLCDRLIDLGCRIDVRLTRYAGELAEIAEHLPEEVDTLIVCGGDGSVNDAVRGLLGRPGAVPALAVLPFGTANVLAHDQKLSFSPRAVAEAVVARRVVPLALGALDDGRPFALMVSAGFDAAVVHAVDPAAKRRWNKLAFVAQAIRLALARSGRDVEIEADGVSRRCRIAVISNSRAYGGPFTLTRHADAARPGLRLVTLSDDAPATLIKAAAALLVGRLDALDAVEDTAVSHVRLAGDGVAVQIDGTADGALPVCVTAAPVALPLVIG